MPLKICSAPKVKKKCSQIILSGDKCRSWTDPWEKSLLPANLFSRSGKEGKGQQRPSGGWAAEFPPWLIDVEEQLWVLRAGSPPCRAPGHSQHAGPRLGVRVKMAYRNGFSATIDCLLGVSENLSGVLPWRRGTPWIQRLQLGWHDMKVQNPGNGCSPCKSLLCLHMLRPSWFPWLTPPARPPQLNSGGGWEPPSTATQKGSISLNSKGKWPWWGGDSVLQKPGEGGCVCWYLNSVFSFTDTALKALEQQVRLEWQSRTLTYREMEIQLIECGCFRSGYGWQEGYYSIHTTKRNKRWMMRRLRAAAPIKKKPWS